MYFQKYEAEIKAITPDPSKLKGYVEFSQELRRLIQSKQSHIISA